MTRYFASLALALALALGVVGCSEASGTGGTRGDGLAKSPQELEAYVDEYVTAHMESPDSPGLVVAVIGPRDVVFEKSYGMANIEESIPIDSDTPFYLASMAKQFTATAVMLLFEDGSIHPDDPVADYFPEARPHPG